MARQLNIQRFFKTPGQTPEEIATVVSDENNNSSATQEDAPAVGVTENEKAEAGRHMYLVLVVFINYGKQWYCDQFQNSCSI